MTLISWILFFLLVAFFSHLFAKSAKEELVLSEQMIRSLRKELSRQKSEYQERIAILRGTIDRIRTK